MATSGIYAYTYTRDQIINAALRKLTVLSEGVSANSTQLSTGAEALNLLVLELQNLGMPLWARAQVSTTLVDGTSSYTISTPRAIRVLQAWYVNGTTSNTTDLQIVSEYNYNLLPSLSEGIPNTITYTPGISSGTLKVWPIPDSTVPATSTVRLSYISELQVFTAGSETPHFPPEWYNAVVARLAVYLAPEYGIPMQDQTTLERRADKLLDIALGGNQEEGSVFFSPAWS